MKTLKQILGLCEHKWEIIKTTEVFETWGTGRYEGQLPAYRTLTLQCEKCGDIKKKKI